MSQNEIDRLRNVYAQRQARVVAGRYDGQKAGELYGLQRRREESFAMLCRHSPQGLAGLRVLDVGCGRGGRLSEWTEWGVDSDNLFGVDLMETFIHQARRSFPEAGWLVASGDLLPFGDGTFNMVTQAMAVSSILDREMRCRFAAEIWRVLAPGGLLLWYDMRFANPWNSDTRPVGMVALASLFPQAPLETRSLTLLPPLARRLAGRFPGVCRCLERLPFLRSHRLALFRKDMP